MEAAESVLRASCAQYQCTAQEPTGPHRRYSSPRFYTKDADVDKINGVTDLLGETNALGGRADTALVGWPVGVNYAACENSLVRTKSQRITLLEQEHIE